MKRKTPTPHDALFRRFLTHAETAREFLEIYLPPALQAVCNLSTLKLESGSFVEENLKAHISDMLYSLETTTGKGYVYCVVEHLCGTSHNSSYANYANYAKKNDYVNLIDGPPGQGVSLMFY